jgi:hypothetical protein
MRQNEGLSRDDEIIVVLGENHLKEAKISLQGTKDSFHCRADRQEYGACIGLEPFLLPI